MSRVDVKDMDLDGIEPCRLVLCLPKWDDIAALEKATLQAIEGGDIASLILAQFDLSDEAFIDFAVRLTPVAQAKDIAVLIHGDSRAVGRAKADGVHLNEGRKFIEAAHERYKGQSIIGSGGAKTRHEALERGEARPDYMCFGLLGGDTHPEAHRKNLALAEWWVSMVEIPCIVAAGASLESIGEAVKTGAEFVLLSRAIFEAEDPANAVAQANQRALEARIAWHREEGVEA